MNSQYWKTTKEVAKVLGLSVKTLYNFRKFNRLEEDGLVIVSSIDTEKGNREGYLWSSEAIKKAMLNISNPKTDQWKEDVITEYTEKEIIIAKTDNLDIIESQAKLILNLIQAKKTKNRFQEDNFILNKKYYKKKSRISSVIK